MRVNSVKRLLVLPLLLLLVIGGVSATPEAVSVPKGINHEAWDDLLGRYVDARGMVDYRAWQAATGDRAVLRAYLAQFAAEAKPAAEGDDRVASLINLYNALTIDWILTNYPVDSIKATPEPWSAKRHRVGGREVSLDEIEHATLRPLAGYRVHAALVCAARSCPPLRREAYRPERLNDQLNDQMRAWLARPDLNQFLPERQRVVLSQIFNWFRDDFDQAGGIRNVLLRFAPAPYRTFLETDYQVSRRPYDWGLNEAE